MLLALAMLAAAAAPKTVTVSMSATTSIGEGLPYGPLTGKLWRAEPDAIGVKLHVHPDEAVMVSKIEITPCKPLTAEVDYYINFEERVGSLKVTGDSLQVAIDPVMSVRSVTLNFGNGTGVCLKSMRLFDPSGTPYTIKTPKVVTGGKVTASSTSPPEQSYEVSHLFDGRFEYAWASKGKGAGEWIDLDLGGAQKVTALKIWNGYQRSAQHCYDNARVKKLTVTGDGGYTATMELKDMMGPQLLQLEKPFTGQKLRLTFDDIYAGKTYKDLVISELRLYDGDEPVLLDPVPAQAAIAKRHKEQFAAAGMSEILNHTVGKGQDGPDGDSWLLRLRSDGSMYLEGYVSEVGESSTKQRQYFALGNYEVKKAGKDGMELRLFGALRKKVNVFENFEGDCNGCGFDCNIGAGGKGDVERVFQETLTLEKRPDPSDGEGTYDVTNVGKKKNLRFELLRFTLLE